MLHDRKVESLRLKIKSITVLTNRDNLELNRRPWPDVDNTSITFTTARMITHAEKVRNAID